MSKSAPQGNHRAVVLGGGGSKGAYQIGVWQALRELGLDYQVVTGTSVGALNGALMAQGEFEAAYALWWEMDNARVMEGIPSAGDTLDSRLAVYRAFVREMVTKGGLDISPLEATIRDILDEEKLRQSGVEYGIVTVDMSTLKPVELFLRDMPPGSVADYMIASASCFPAFKPRTIEKARFIDGGYYDNLPVHTVRSCWDLGNFLIFEKDQCRRNIRLGYLDAMKEAGRYDGRAYAFPAGEGDVFRRARGPAMAELTRRVLEPLEEPARAAVEALALARVRGKLRRRRLGEDLLLAAAETAGELLGLDPTRVYTMAELDDALRERVRLERDRQGGQELTLDTLPGEGGSITEALAALGKELALLSVLENLAQYLAGEAPILRPGLLAAALPREFLACLYLIVAL